MEVLSSRTIIVTGDLDRARSFYQDILGLRVYREYGAGGAVTGVVLFLGGGFLELTAGTAEPVGDGVKLWLQVPDLAAEAARLSLCPVKVNKPMARMPWGLIEFWIEDPDGMEIRLIEVPSDHPLRGRLR
ncbi:MAG TPA: VOC family protein [Acidimicrobiales bacterium]|jgi:predicted enzyme related to lactoylglutathione lyase